MKLKFLWSVLAVSLINPACADTSMTQKALKPVIEYQCGQELKDSKVWKMGTYFMAEANKQHLQQKCVAVWVSMLWKVCRPKPC